MKLTERDQKIVLLLPAVVVFAVYGWFFFPARQTAWKRAGVALDNARANAPALREKVQQTQAKLAQANYGLRQRESDKERARQAWDRAAAHCTDPSRRNDRIARLNGLLARRGLRMVEDAEADAGKDGKVAGPVENLCKELASMSGQHKPQLRKVRLVGRYLDVLGALEDLASRDVVAIPVGLLMKEAHPNYHVREWVLLVWI